MMVYELFFEGYILRALAAMRIRESQPGKIQENNVNGNELRLSASVWMI